ncbi:MAG: maltokinase N-terminal cap-like domain-containing protein [Brevibacterium aurantiacum]|uniref:Maltokinase N-terminal cap domain-containing protein n=2 Tax=Brevibacterium TaxID=1696 RepID=A0A1D7W5V1_BREAU|nr:MULTISPECIES: hypothetical protein [Brevibacterium]MDN5594725.1 hypothetical protein [Brevibacterium sp.]AOP54340.1 hypothetical protein BLSMQ_2634 [Brevibacterium aurantiacum]AZL06402.1 hypothetical protein CXR24_13025 [Brevibacterium aurantiacum]AZL09960.1 hypothetical protein CXR26_12540 [Brevibacterium aurantiacum]AZL13613.1 hypothetical protein CXR25_12910 [Brevibacterium aurantiacum]
MADIYSAELNPGKLDVISAWLSKQSWAAEADVAPESLKKVTSYRFDDPEGKVGAEIHIVAAGDRVFQVPLTYRGVELAGADKHLISTMEHSILGTRWVYDGMGDPHFRQRLDHAIATAGTSAKQYRVDDEGNRIDEITDVAHAWGTGPLAGAEDVQVLYELNLDSPAEGSDAGLLLGRWAGQEAPVVLAVMV